MAESERIVRFKHVPLPTQQRRVRHLRYIVVRNLGFTRRPPEDGVDISHYSVYFTLHRDLSNPAYYSSEKIKGSLNPTWRSFHLIDTDAPKNTACSSFVIRLWRARDKLSLEAGNHVYKMFLEWTVDLTGLVYLGEKVPKDTNQQTNTLIFGLVDGFYGAPPPNQGPPPELNPARCSLTVDQAWVKTSYSIHTLSRVQTILRAIRQTQVSVARVRENIEEKLLQSQEQQRKKAEQEALVTKVTMMRGDLEWRTMKLQGEKGLYETQQAQSCHKDIFIKTKYETLLKDKTRLHDKKKNYFDIREELIKTGAQLVLRRKQLISELACIYPVKQPSNGIFTICGVKLPNSEDFAGRDDTMISVGLGYTCHLLQMISQFLDVPLRYPMEGRGSRSQIKDHIIDKLSEKERDFPLYAKGKEKFQFNYGVYLINKNIAQMRYYCGLGTTDLRLTLPNLKSLLELRLGVKFEPSNSLLPGQHQVPPNLGGPQRLTSPSFGMQATSQILDKDTPVGPLTYVTGDNKFEQLLQESKKDRLSLMVKTRGGLQLDKPVISRKTPSVVKDGNNKENMPSNERETFPSADEELFKSSPDSFFKVKGEDTERHETENDEVDCGTDVISELDKEAEDEVTHHHITADVVVHAPAHHVSTLEQLTKEKLLGPVATYDDIDVSSSEDSSVANYGSKFKLWPRELSQSPAHAVHHLCQGEQISTTDTNGCDPPTLTNMRTSDEVSGSDATFKTNAMLGCKTNISIEEVSDAWDIIDCDEGTVDEGKTSSSNPTVEQIDIQQRTDALWESSAKSFKLPHRQSDCDDHAVSPSLALSDTVS